MVTIAAVTQLVECPAVNRIVTGSSPVGGVTLFLFTKHFLSKKRVPGVLSPCP